MGKILNPQIQMPAPPPPPPTPDSGEAQAAMKRAADEERNKARGRAATLLTSGTGLSEPATTSKKVLLGS